MEVNFLKKIYNRKKRGEGGKEGKAKRNLFFSKPLFLELYGVLKEYVKGKRGKEEDNKPERQ